MIIQSILTVIHEEESLVGRTWHLCKVVIVRETCKVTPEQFILPFFIDSPQGETTDRFKVLLIDRKTKHIHLEVGIKHKEELAKGKVFKDFLIPSCILDTKVVYDVS